MVHLILDHSGILPDLERRIGDLYRRQSVIGGRAPQPGLNTADLWAKEIGPGGRANVAAQLLLNLIHPRERRDASFWGTPLGRALAWWTGGEEVQTFFPADETGPAAHRLRGVQRAEAAAALHITRQGLYEWLGRDPTRFDPQGTASTGVSALGLRTEMHLRFPLGS